MNKISKIFLTLTCSIVLPAQAALVVLDEIIAVVDEDVIMRSELEVRRVAVESQMTAQKQELPPREVLEKQIMERLVIESLQLQMAERAGIRISDEELNTAMTRIAAQNNLSLEQFSRNIELEGISYLNMRDQVKREISINRVQQGIMRRRIQVTEQEINNFLDSELGATVTADEYHLAHILVPLPEEANEAQIKSAKMRVEALISRLENGGDFKTIAIENSAAPDAVDGGDLGWRKAVQLPTLFAEIAPEMQADEIRGPIASGSGFHIVKLFQKRGAAAEGQIAQTEVRHILLKPSEILSDQECQDLLTVLRDEIVDGRDFEEVAKLHSDDPGSALSGGDLGWAREGLFVPAFEQAMLAGKEGELSPVFKSSHGYHILEVTGRRIKNFSKEFKMGQAENFLRNQKFDEELQSWMREIRDGAFVEVRI